MENKTSLKLNILLCYAGTTADSLTTHVFRQKGIHERNDVIPINGLSMADLINSGKEIEAWLFTMALYSVFMLILSRSPLSDSYKKNILRIFTILSIAAPIYNTLMTP